MKSVVLLPYCPLPANTGGKAEMWQHLQILKQMGECKVLSARRRPVGTGWTDDTMAQFRKAGFDVRIREDDCPGMSGRQVLGMLYAYVFKGLRMEKAFGHGNPYHRYAFPEKWWADETADADLVLINYSYYAWLPCKCPKVINLLDLFSDVMWGGHELEAEDLKKADLVLTISVDEESKLNSRGVMKTLWVPPVVLQRTTEDSDQIALVGSDSISNREGLDWLVPALSGRDIRIRVYGGLSRRISSSCLIPVRSYEDRYQPYCECGIVLMTTVLGVGVQIKSVEALACGKAIIARKGAMRGLPPDSNAWIEVSTAEEMLSVGERLRNDQPERTLLADAAKSYYSKYLNSETIVARLKKTYTDLIGKSHLD